MAYEYDAVGNRTKRTDYLSQITNYTYDNLNRLTNVTYPDSTENITLTYDVISQLTKATKNAQDVTFIYDKRRQVTSTTDIFGKIVASVYDASGNRTTLKLDGTNFATYTYDVADRLTKITNSADAKAVSYTYDNANRMTKETLPNTIATTFNYDGMSRLKEIKDVKGTTTLFDRNYTYNTANQISQIAELTQTRNFGYDNLDRLTSVTGSTSENYAFDGVGNRTSSNQSATYAYQPFNKLTNTATTSYVYNSNGNMTQKTNASGTTLFYWDYENRLKQVILPNGQNVVYKYDALGRRSERNVNNGTSWTKFTYDGQDVILDQNSDGTSVTYLNGAGIDNKIRQTANGQAQYFLSDHLGSTNALTDATGAVIASTNYDSFGNATNANFPTRYQFTGREFDNLTGLQYSRARWYDANLGRFISEDPIGLVGGINEFVYVNNNPINLTDPQGLAPSIIDHLFGDGGIFTRQTFSELLSGVERSKKQCKSTWTQRFTHNFYETNAALPGLLAPTIGIPGLGLGALTSGATAKTFGGLTPLRWMLTGFRGAVVGADTFTVAETAMVVGATTVINFALVSGAYESGIAIGSAINATFGFSDYCPCDK
jgi:RHS repeat-associated protein